MIDLGKNAFNRRVKRFKVGDIIARILRSDNGRGFHDHTVYNWRFTGERGFHLTVNTVYGSAGTAESVAASASVYELLADLFDCRHDRKIFGYFICFSV